MSRLTERVKALELRRPTIRQAFRFIARDGESVQQAVSRGLKEMGREYSDDDLYIVRVIVDSGNAA